MLHIFITHLRHRCWVRCEQCRCHHLKGQTQRNTSSRRYEMGFWGNMTAGTDNEEGLYLLQWRRHNDWTFNQELYCMLYAITLLEGMYIEVLFGLRVASFLSILFTRRTISFHVYKDYTLMASRHTCIIHSQSQALIVSGNHTQARKWCQSSALQFLQPHSISSQPFPFHRVPTLLVKSRDHNLLPSTDKTMLFPNLPRLVDLGDFGSLTYLRFRDVSEWRRDETA